MGLVARFSCVQECSCSGPRLTCGKLSLVLFWCEAEAQTVLQLILTWDRRCALEMQTVLQSWVSEPPSWLLERWDLQPEMAVGEIHTSSSCFGSGLDALSPRLGKGGFQWVWLGKVGAGILCCVTDTWYGCNTSVRLSLLNSCLFFHTHTPPPSLVVFLVFPLPPSVSLITTGTCNLSRQLRPLENMSDKA